MAWDFDPKLPVTLQIEQRLRSDIVSGKYAPGSQFPAVRQLAQDAAVNPNTMQKALANLEAEGLLLSRGTVGRFVTADTAVLESTLRHIRQEYLESMYQHAIKLGITKDMFMEYMTDQFTERS